MELIVIYAAIGVMIWNATRRTKREEDEVRKIMIEMWEQFIAESS
jgi:hypothetical protein